MANSKKVVIVGDDFGVTTGTNQAMLRAYQEGILTELSLMVDAPKTLEAVKLTSDYNITQVGLHQILFSWDPQKRFNRSDYIKLFKESTDEYIVQLANDEFKRFEDLLGRKPTHITAQYGIHGNLKLLEAVIQYAKANSIPVRLPKVALTNADIDNSNYAAEVTIKRSGVKMCDYLFAHVLGSEYDVVKDAYLNDLSTVFDGESCEIAMHPSYLDEELLEVSSLGYERVRDLKLVLDSDFKEKVTNLGFDIVNYSQI